MLEKKILIFRPASKRKEVGIDAKMKNDMKIVTVECEANFFLQ